MSWDLCGGRLGYQFHLVDALLPRLVAHLYLCGVLPYLWSGRLRRTRGQDVEHP